MPELDETFDGVPMKGTVGKGGAITFTPVKDTSPEMKFSKALAKVLDSMSFSLATLASVIVFHFPPILQRKMYWLFLYVIDRWAESWERDDQDPDLEDITRNASLIRKTLKEKDEWDV